MALYFDGQKRSVQNNMMQLHITVYLRMMVQSTRVTVLRINARSFALFFRITPTFIWLRKHRTTAIPGRILTAPVFAVFCMRYNQKESTALLLRICPDWAESISKRESILK